MAKKSYIAPAVLEQQEIVFETLISGQNNGLHNGNGNGNGNHAGGGNQGTNPGKGNK